MVVGKENMEATAPVVDEGGEIVKPRTDKREYRRIVLKNSLEVLLISDPETDKVRFVFVLLLPIRIEAEDSYVSPSQCAASMDVSVGSFSDPQGLEGIAHFLGTFNPCFNDLSLHSRIIQSLS